MTDRVTHPSLDVLADHHEGLLPASEAMRVNGHLAGCDQCRGFVDALDGVRDVLRENGPATMPDWVTARLDAAIASESRERTTAEAAAASTAGADRHRRRGRLLVAAAAVGVLGIGGIVAAGSQRSGNQGSNSSTSAGGSAADRSATKAGLGQAVAPSRPGIESAKGTASLTINQDNFVSIAPLAIAGGRSATPETSRSCLAAAVAGYRRDGWASTQVRWAGRPAWLVVDLSGRHAYVVDCQSAARVLYQHKF